MQKKIAIFLLIVEINIYFYDYQDHRNINTQKPKIGLAANTIKKEFGQD